MLGNLLKKIKKQNTINKNNGIIQQDVASTKLSMPQNYEQSCKQSISKIENYKIDQYLKELWRENSEYKIDLPFNKVRYFTLEGLPNLGPLVRNCKFSTFHQLKHSNRKVKQIALARDNNPQKKQQGVVEHQMYPLPEYIKFLQPLFVEQIPNYNHILINDYPAGIGIMPHTDGPLYHNRVIVLSLQGYSIISFTEKPKKEDILIKPQSHKILLQPDSIHIFEQQAYTQHLHGIQNGDYDQIDILFDYQQDKVLKSNIYNYNQLKCRKHIQNLIKSKISKADNSDQFIKVETIQQLAQNGLCDYNFRVFIKRCPRISITVRQKYKQTQISSKY